MKARFFSPDDAMCWDDFCDRSPAATFLHSRQFLSYHGDKFLDQSIVLEDGGSWLGVVPAARHPTEHHIVLSHPGITYGGVLHNGRLYGSGMLLAFEAAAALWRTVGLKRLQYKPVPHIYQSAPAQDDLYALFRKGAVRYRCDLSSCIDLRHRLPVAKRRLRAQKKAEQADVSVTAGHEHLNAVWRVLEENLLRKHGTKPVHTVDDMRALVARFPDKIHVIAATIAGKVESGIVIFLSNAVAHAQYIASSEQGYKVNALDLIFEVAIERYRSAGKRYFDFGVSTEDQGYKLNDGLNRFKNEFGAGGVAYEFYEWNFAGDDNAVE
ncbi:GNAT family N-acetyltransferase [Paraburkholderia sp. RCC_158]|uniref:GNAT family N-acetyltransferase n=1 Tax=Paraburkholderia sp. RCC_158 TaxID=3239220 RepID=UPI0035234442